MNRIRNIIKTPVDEKCEIVYRMKTFKSELKKLEDTVLGSDLEIYEYAYRKNSSGDYIYDGKKTDRFVASMIDYTDQAFAFYYRIVGDDGLSEEEKKLLEAFYYLSVRIAAAEKRGGSLYLYEDGINEWPGVDDIHNMRGTFSDFFYLADAASINMSEKMFHERYEMIERNTLPGFFFHLNFILARIDKANCFLHSFENNDEEHIYVTKKERKEALKKEKMRQEEEHKEFLEEYGMTEEEYNNIQIEAGRA